MTSDAGRELLVSIKLPLGRHALWHLPIEGTDSLGDSSAFHRFRRLAASLAGWHLYTSHFARSAPPAWCWGT
jgi:hypothetical protein